MVSTTGLDDWREFTSRARPRERSDFSPKTRGHIGSKIHRS